VITRFGAAMPTSIARRLDAHLQRSDGQEECCFVLWRPATAATRFTALIVDVVLPGEDERIVHGNVEFTSEYFLRAASIAAEQGRGMGLIHSHPRGRGWQSLNRVDYAAEASFATQASALTGHPLLGMTYAGKDCGYSARLWSDQAPGECQPAEGESVRVVGDQFAVTFNDRIKPAPAAVPTQVRTVSAWGQDNQDVLARLNVGVVGNGSVGMIIVEAIARTGIGRLTLLDVDSVETVNLDRLLHSTQADAESRRAKVELAEEAARRAATCPGFEVTAKTLSVVEPDGYALAADCDVLFSCVDRPWPRQAMNMLAYTHLVPVVDGGVRADGTGGTFHGAEWRGHVAGPGRACLECLGQYDPADVATERAGLLEDAAYIAGLPDGHHLRRKENVFIFSVAAASSQLNQFLTMVTAPSGIADTGAHLFHLTTGTVDRLEEGCKPECRYSGDLLLLGDSAPPVTGRDLAAENARAYRKKIAE
jgi:hypothetical protein